MHGLILTTVVIKGQCGGANNSPVKDSSEERTKLLFVQEMYYNVKKGYNLYE